MKRIAVVGLGLIGMLCRAQSTPKQVTEIKNVVGTVNNMYALVRTTIYKESPKTTGEGIPAVENKPIVTREVMGNPVGPLNKNSGPIDVALKIPTLDARVKTYGAPQMINKLGAVVGAVSGPKGQMAGVGISTMAVLADYASQVAEQELNDLYGTQNYEFTVLEIIPMRYYQVNTTNQKIEVTDAFLEDFPKYQKQLQRYKTAFELYRNINRVYAQWTQAFGYAYTKLTKEQVDRQVQSINDYYKSAVMPALKIKNKEESALAQMYPPYRIAIMASPIDPGTSCSVSGAGSGPWELTLVYYAGAQQTNRIGVKFCVPNPQSKQLVQVSLVQNAIEYLQGIDQRFVPGGIRLVGASGTQNPNINFARDEAYGAKETPTFNWFNSMVINTEGGDITQFLVPFDIYELKKTAAAEQQAKQDAKMQLILSSMDQVIDRAKEAKRAAQELEQRKKYELGNIGDREGLSLIGESSLEERYGRTVGGTSSSESGEPIEGESPEDEAAAAREVEEKGQVLDQELGEGVAGEEPPPVPQLMGPQLTAPMPAAWQDMDQVRRERDALASDIEIVQATGGRISGPINLKWHPDKKQEAKAGDDVVTRYTEYFKVLNAKDISVLDNFLRSIGYNI